jgi:two-component sensor histidine kinase
MLHAQGSTDALDFGAYIRALCASLAATLGADGRGREIVVEVEPVTVAPVTAQALALAVSELVTNAFRHGFAPEAPGTVWVQGRRGADGGFRLTVADDGKGLPAVFGVGRGTGHQRVAIMAEQGGADLEVAGKSGACFTLAVPASCIG